MQIKEVKPINFLYFRTSTKVNELGRFVGIVARELYRDAVFNDLEITGPVYWNYFGFDGDESRPFILEIALPLSELPRHYTGKFQIKRSDPFHCVSIVHEGSWYDMPKGYAKLKEFISANSLVPNAENREVYLNIDFINSQGNITEIQIGITPESAGILEPSRVNAGGIHKEVLFN